MQFSKDEQRREEARKEERRIVDQSESRNDSIRGYCGGVGKCRRE